MDKLREALIYSLEVYGMDWPSPADALCWSTEKQSSSRKRELIRPSLGRIQSIMLSCSFLRPDLRSISRSFATHSQS